MGGSDLTLIASQRAKPHNGRKKKLGVTIFNAGRYAGQMGQAEAYKKAQVTAAASVKSTRMPLFKRALAASKIGSNKRVRSCQYKCGLTNTAIVRFNPNHSSNRSNCSLLQNVRKGTISRRAATTPENISKS